MRRGPIPPVAMTTGSPRAPERSPCNRRREFRAIAARDHRRTSIRRVTYWNRWWTVAARPGGWRVPGSMSFSLRWRKASRPPSSRRFTCPRRSSLGEHLALPVRRAQPASVIDRLPRRHPCPARSDRIKRSCAGQTACGCLLRAYGTKSADLSGG